MKTCATLLKFGASLLAMQASLSPAAFAQEADYVLDEIIVTAQKREQGLKDVPMSVSVMSGSMLENSQIGSFSDLSNLSSSLTFKPSDGRTDAVFIRGIGTLGFQSGMEPTVSTVVDGVVMGRTGSFLSDLVDIERIEVLRGPQSTLFGKNASGGVISIITKAPTDEFEGTVALGAAEDGEYSVKGTVSGEIATGVRGRLTGFYKSFDGLSKNVVTGEDVNGSESWGVRGRLDFDRDMTTFSIIADWQEKTSDGGIYSIERALNPTYVADLEAAGITLGVKNNDVATGSGTFAKTSNGGIALTINHDFGASTLTSITAMRTWKHEANADIDGLPFEGATFGHGIPAVMPFGLFTQFNVNGGSSKTKTFSQELRIANNEPATVDYVLGLFYWKQNLERYFERGLETCLAPAGFLGGVLPGASDTCGYAPDALPAAGYATSFGYFNTDVDTTNLSAFGQLTWNVSERARIVAGGRLTNDKMSYTFDRPTGALLFPAVAPYQGQDEGSKTAVSGKFSAQYDVSDTTMTYASITRGYKSPAWDIIFGMSAIDAVKQPIKAETSISLEVGIKSYIADGKGFIALTAFHTDYKNFQAQTFDPLSTSFKLASVGKARTKGVELDIMLKPTRTLSLNGGVSYGKAYFVDYPGAQCWAGQTVEQGCSGLQDLSGADMVNAPKLKVNLAARQDIILDGSADMFVTLGVNYKSKTQFSLNQNPDTIEGSHFLMNASIGIQDDEGRWTAVFYVKNLTNKFYRASVFQNPIESGGLAHLLPRDYKRYIGATLKYNF